MPNATLIPTHQEQFKQVLSELADQSLAEYFTDDKQLNQLVDWLLEETRVPKLAIRFTLKKIIPFIASKSNELAGKAIEGWRKKLHDRLSEYSWYLHFCTTLLNVLKSKTDQTYAHAVDHPDTEHLDQLLHDPARWENLKDEQKGVIQLLFGQKYIQQLLNEQAQSAQVELQYIRQVIDQILKAVQYSITLDTPEYKTPKTQADFNAGWLTYTQRQIDLLSRESELNWLSNFLESNNTFAWCAITGAGGSGKSRLALESLFAHQNHWECGFISSDELSAHTLTQWQPECPMYLVIDYAATYPESVRQWLSYCAKHQHRFDYPVRIVLLERASDGQQWWQRLLHTGKSEDQALRNALYRAPNGEETLKLDLFDHATQQKALYEFLSKLESPCANQIPKDESWCQRIHELSNRGTPLFIGLIALAIHHAAQVQEIHGWSRIQLLNHILDHERTHWCNALNDLRQGQKTFSDDVAYQLLALSCMVGGVSDSAQVEQLCQQAKLDVSVTDATQILRQLSNDPKCRLQPDLLAEFFVLTLAQEIEKKGFEGDFIPLVSAAHRCAPNELYEFIQRCVMDYPKDGNSFKWWSTLAKQNSTEDSVNDRLNELAIDIAAHLRQTERYSEAETPWLSALFKQPRTPLIDARALNMRGLINFDQGEYDKALRYLEESKTIQEAIGDRAGLGVTLNNISQIYDAQGDYETALEYLQESKTIQEAIGDRAGLGATLNNISQIYKVRGDYETALEYLQESKTIREAIGDRAGLGVTLSNISAIYHAQGDYETALEYLQESKTIREAIGDRAGLGATLFNLGHIAMKNEQIDVAMHSWAQAYVIAQAIGYRQLLDALGGLSQPLGLSESADASVWAAIVEKMNGAVDG